MIVCLLLSCVATNKRSDRESGSAELASGPVTDQRSLRFDGRVRTYRIHVPPSYDGSTPIPLVFAFHGGGGQGRSQARLSNLDDVSDREGFIVVYPDGVGRSWNAGHGAGEAESLQVDDVGFVSELIDTLANDFRIDRRRVHATGMSNGGIFVHRLACELSDEIASVASVAGTMPSKLAQTCNPARPISVMQIHGTADKFNPWQGGKTRGDGQVESVRDTIEGWIRRNQCPLVPEITAVGEEVVCERYGPCQWGTEVMLCRIEGGGHTWPGGWQYLPEVLIGKTNRELNASDAIWGFFVKHPLTQP